MPLPIALINQTPNEIGIVDLGIFVPPGSGTILDLTGLYLIEEVRDSSDLQEQTVVSGSIVISGSEGVLSSAAAARFFTGSQIAEQNFTTEGIDLRDLRNIVVVGGDEIVVTSGEVNQVLNFTVSVGENVLTDALVGAGNVTVTSGTNVITISGASVSGGVGDVTGDLINAEFTGGGTTSNTWLSVSTKDHASNQIPFVMLYPSRITGVGYSNSSNSSDIDIEIHKSLAASGTDTSLEFTWELRDTRIATKSDFGIDEITFETGDKLALFASRVTPGKNPKDVIVSVYIEITDTSSTETVEDYSGDFS